MQSDLPHTLYRHDRKEGRKKEGRKRDVKKPFRYNPKDPAIAKQEEANRRAAERRQARREGKVPYTIEELFRKQ